MMSSTKIVNNTLKNWSSSQKILNYLSEKNVYENIYKNFEKIKT